MVANTLGLFDGVDAEVGFEVEVEGEHVCGVAGLVGDEGEDAGFDIASVDGTGDGLDGSGAGDGAGRARR